MYTRSSSLGHEFESRSRQLFTRTFNFLHRFSTKICEIFDLNLRAQMHEQQRSSETTSEHRYKSKSKGAMAMKFSEYRVPNLLFLV